MFSNRPIPAASAVVINAANEVLLVQRGSAPYEGFWSLPGGAVEWGETLEEAATREVHEECGIDIQIKQLNTAMSRIVRDDAGIQYHYVIVNFIASCAQETIHAGSDAKDARWVPVNQLSQYRLTEGIKETIHKALIPSR
jgi:8-oxo-dGTP diphosphatase